MQQMCPHVRYAVELALRGLLNCEKQDFAGMIDALAQEVIYIRAGEGGEYPFGNEEVVAVDRAGREILDAYYELLIEYDIERVLPE